MAVRFFDKQYVFLDSLGVARALGKLYSYATATSTPLATYSDNALGTPNATTLTLSLAGRLTADVFGAASDYKFIVTNADGSDSITIDPAHGAVTSADASFLQAGTGAVSRTVQAKLRDIISVKDFGAVGDGATDDTAAIQSAIAITGALVWFPHGTYKHTATLTPACGGLIGEGRLVSILKPTSAVSKALSVGGANYPTLLSNFQIDGSNTTGSAVGAFIGDASSVGLLAEEVLVQNFAATNWRIGDVLKSTFLNCTGKSSGGANWLIQKVSAGFPTTTLFDSCVGTNAGTKNWYVVDADHLVWRNCVADSATQEGMTLLPASGGTIKNAQINMRFESNYGSNTAQFQFVAGDGTSLGGAIINPILDNCKFQLTGSTAKAARFNGSAVGFVMHNPVFDSPVASAVSVDNSAFGEITSWCPLNSNISTIVSDTGNKCALPPWAQNRAWTPTISGSTGTFSATTISTADYKLVGKLVYVTFNITTTPSGATTYIALTVPTNLTPGNSSAGTGAMADGGARVSIGGTWSAGFVEADQDGHLYIVKSDASAFTGAAATIIRGSLIYGMN